MGLILAAAVAFMLAVSGPMTTEIGDALGLGDVSRDRLPGLLFTPMAIYPFLERWVTGDNAEHHVLDRPRNVPTRTGLGVMALSTWLILLAAGANDILAVTFHLSINMITNSFRVLIFVVPPLAYVVTKRICLGLQRRDRDLVLHGRETGRIVRLPHGEMIEVHEPISEARKWELTQHLVRDAVPGRPGRPTPTACPGAS